MRAIIGDNGLTPPYHLRTGQRLRIPPVIAHEVRPGDTLSDISNTYGISVYDLARVNGLTDRHTILVGQRLTVPRVAVAARPAAAPRARAAPQAKLASQAKATPQATSTTQAKSAPKASAARTAMPPPPVAPPTMPPLAPQPPATPPPTLVAKVPPPAPAPQPAPAPTAVSMPRPPPLSGKGFLWPVTGKVVTPFGPQARGLHNDGINIAAPRGTPVVAADDGVIAYAGNELRGFGNLLLIKHRGGWVTAYAHNGALLVSRGETVRRGQVIARVGSTGGVSAPQLHFELRRGNRARDPAKQLSPAVGRAVDPEASQRARI